MPSCTFAYSPSHSIQREAGALLDVRKADLEEFWESLYSSAERRMLITEIVPNSGPAASRKPPKTTGYATKAPEKESTGIKLGIDDIERFRKDREMFLEA